MSITHLKEIDENKGQTKLTPASEKPLLSKDSEYKEIIFDFNEDLSTRLDALQYYFDLKNDETVEILSRLTGMYQFSGTKLLEDYLYNICIYSNLPSFIKLEAAIGLVFYEEYPECITKEDSVEMAQIKTESNKKILERDTLRRKRASKALDATCYMFGDGVWEQQLATPRKIEAVCILMEFEEYKINSLNYFIEIVNDSKIDCDYRYKAILSLEKLKKVSNLPFFLFNSCLKFLGNDKNMTMYRILSGQYILQKMKPVPEGHLTVESKTTVQNTLLSFAYDEELDYNLRADAADTLLNLGEPHIQIQAREIIMLLGTHLGTEKTIFDNAQNVHASEIEKSVREIIEYLSCIEPLKIDKSPINFGYVYTKIEEILKNKGYKAQQTPNKDLCSYCGTKIPENSTCSPKCDEEYKKVRYIKISLNRIQVDRMLYSHYNQTLSNILIKIWTFIDGAGDNKEVLTERLLEELIDMSGTCSSGFASRLCNVISGFSDLTVRIGFEDQIIANFSGRLNAKLRDIKTSGFYKENYKEVVEIYMKENGIDGKVEDYLKSDRDFKIDRAIDEFYENIQVELCGGMKDYSKKPHFKKFFIDILPNIKETMYIEFSPYMSDPDWDLYIRKAVMMFDS